jgi:hypothetical protein
MTEILTESFCERCGTRYTFESAAPRKSRLGRVKVLSKGVRNFVMSDDASLSEALAEARSEEELAATASQLDAFHQTFNFCLTCRQYTCSDCWNGPEGRCLTCAPIPGQEEPAALIDLAPRIAVEPSDDGRVAAAEAPGAWPAIDLGSAADLDAAVAASLSSVEVPAESAAPGSPAWPDAGASTPAGPAADTESAAAGPEPASEAGEPAIVPPPVRRLAGIAPGQSLDDAIAAYEAMLAADEPEVQAAVEASAPTEPLAVDLPAEPPIATDEPAADTGVAAEPVVDAPVGAEPVAAEPVAAEPAATEPASAAPEPVVEAPVAAEPAATEPARPALPGIDRVAQPTWPLPPAPARPETPPELPTQAPVRPANPWLRVAPDETPVQPAAGMQPSAQQPAAQQPAAPEWPATPQWPAPPPRPEAPLTLAGRTLLPQADASALWAASAKEVLGAAPAPVAATPAATAQPCISCGLSLSANARFCRRCGSRQG